MSQEKFVPTLEQKIAVSMAYLAYSGEQIILRDNADESVPIQILDIIHKTIPLISVLLDANKAPDWKIVWGPTIYTFSDAILQDNMMFVAQQISEPSNYIVAIRGTNQLALLDWTKEDFKVCRKVAWPLPEGVNVGKAKISRATHIGFDALLNKMIPVKGLPGEGKSITQFLTEIASNGKIQVMFTGHSLAGALAPTLALWFKQQQDSNNGNGWDGKRNATISTITFAGATAGNHDFANYSDQLFGEHCQRIWNALDIVPHAWEIKTLKEMPDIYQSAGIRMPFVLRMLLKVIELTVRDYQQIKNGIPFSWTIQPNHDSYLSQVGVQHSDSYPVMLEVPELNEVIDRGKIL